MGKFNNYRYYPAFSTRPNEIRSYDNIDDKSKNLMLPVVSLTRALEAASFSPAAETLAQALGGRTVIVDFDPNPRPVKSHQEIEEARRKRDEKRRSEGKEPFNPTEKQERRWRLQREAVAAFNEHLEEVRSGANGYEAWRKVATAHPNFVPVVKLGNIAEAEKMVDTLIGAGRRMAFRVDVRDQTGIDVFFAVVPKIIDSQQAVVILDAGYIRGDLPWAEKLANAVLRQIEATLPPSLWRGLAVVSMASSFPNSLADLPSPLPILERELRDRLIGVGWDVIYGDYAAIQPRTTMAAAKGWFPHVEVAHSREWHFRRSALKSDAKGYIRSAGNLVSDSGVWPGRPAGWGAALVSQAAAGRLDHGTGLRLTTPGPWVGVRMHQHMTQQVHHP